ncbi:hypothetical protein J8V57_18060 [Xenorhabdus sp. PB61.4]|uniref:hypothetical protein n=1 Tax=Xenorhabdus sp. PB61.4 TaxID=2788940 RepID=UPI001E5F5E4B|nr:hypothetical protein [Xenorhabdus sp. PB61.4]MCC8368132.1 hypothetical protein [Xenorhabdus sp. PB61.4]
MKSLLITFLVSCLLVGCVNGRLRVGTPPVNGIVSAVESKYSERPSSMVSAGAIVTLHTDTDVFQYLEKYCQDKKAIFENPIPWIGWCVTQGMYPLFIFHGDPVGGMSIKEKSTNAEDNDWVDYTKKYFGILWYTHKFGVPL